ncbi:hypothetical protein A0H81_02934 [Grifola frondosa]|uniref:Uncharacterized protein n=1 Tax=Grifola frondosa TaxID=5627 RepID=A0A1C7MHA1_GRIFR|nr:hypothetical protein A0H81_02934 [Grifola frondosa]
MPPINLFCYLLLEYLFHIAFLGSCIKYWAGDSIIRCLKRQYDIIDIHTTRQSMYYVQHCTGLAIVPRNVQNIIIIIFSPVAQAQVLVLESFGC